MTEVVFLGTSSMVPTKERNQSALLMLYDNEGILVDCGEGTQRQLKYANISLTKITKILITHWHGDHTLGLPGLFQSLAASEYQKTLEVYGPKGTKQRIKKIYDAFAIDRWVPMKVFEIGEGVFFSSKEFNLESYSLEHGVDTVGYVFIEKDRFKINMSKVKRKEIPEGPLLGKLQEGEDILVAGKVVKAQEVTKRIKGKKIGIISDTLPCDSCSRIAADADLLICEATYSSKLEEKSKEYRHMTSRQAAMIASNANVKKLILTHFSARYKSTFELNEDARDIFKNTICAYDLMKIKL